MKKRITMVLLTLSLLGAVACGTITTDQTKTPEETVVAVDVKSSEEVVEADPIVKVKEKIALVNADVKASVVEIETADTFEKLTEISNKLADYKNQYVSLMVECSSEDLADVKNALFLTTKAFPSLKEDTDEAKAKFVEKSAKLSEAVDALDSLVK